MLQKLFSLEIGAQSANEADFQHFLNKVLFLNQEFLKKNVVILEEKLSQTVFSQQAKNFEIADLKSQIEKLEKVFLGGFNENFF